MQLVCTQAVVIAVLDVRLARSPPRSCPRRRPFGVGGGVRRPGRAVRLRPGRERASLCVIASSIGRGIHGICTRKAAVTCGPGLGSGFDPGQRCRSSDKSCATNGVKLGSHCDGTTSIAPRCRGARSSKTRKISASEHQMRRAQRICGARFRGFAVHIRGHRGAIERRCTADSKAHQHRYRHHDTFACALASPCRGRASRQALQKDPQWGEKTPAQAPSKALCPLDRLNALDLRLIAPAVIVDRGLEALSAHQPADCADVRTR
jgi:hypothetical protein